MSEYRVDDNASLRLITYQRLDASAWHVARTTGLLGRDARLHQAVIGIGAHYDRSRNDAELQGAGAANELRTTFLGSGDQVHDFRTRQFHVGARTTLDAALQGRGRRRVAVGLHRTDRDRKGCEAHRRSPDQSQLAAVAVGARRQRAESRHSRERRHVRARLERGAAGRTAALVPRVARGEPRGRAASDDPGLLLRDARRRCRRSSPSSSSATSTSVLASVDGGGAVSAVDIGTARGLRRRRAPSDCTSRAASWSPCGSTTTSTCSTTDAATRSSASPTAKWTSRAPRSSARATARCFASKDGADVTLPATRAGRALRRARTSTVDLEVVLP